MSTDTPPSSPATIVPEEIKKPLSPEEAAAKLPMVPAPFAASLKDKISEALSGLLEAQQGALSSDLIEAYEGAKTGVAKGREGAVERLAIKRGELDGEVSSFVQVLKAQIGVLNGKLKTILNGQVQHIVGTDFANQTGALSSGPAYQQAVAAMEVALEVFADEYKGWLTLQQGFERGDRETKPEAFGPDLALQAVFHECERQVQLFVTQARGEVLAKVTS